MPLLLTFSRGQDWKKPVFFAMKLQLCGTKLKTAAQLKIACFSLCLLLEKKIKMLP
jgi:hypothetical protein